MSKSLTYTLLFLIMMIWGFNVTAIKVLVDNFAPVTITAFRILVAGIVVMLFLGINKEFHRTNKTQLGYITLGALTGILGHHFFLATGLTMTNASNAGLILGLVPLMTSVFAIIFLGDRLTVLRMIGIILGFSGVAFIVLSGGGNVGSISRGDVNIFLAVVTQAISFIAIKRATESMDSRLITGWMQIIGAFFLFVVSLQLEPRGLASLTTGSPGAWLVFFASAILATALGHMVYNKAIGQIGAGETAIFTNLTPFFSLIGAVVFLGETIAWQQLFGFLFIVMGVVLGTGALDKRKEDQLEAGKSRQVAR
ncbi:DMT family transporter [Thalassobacillus pellis]|uniref:DMT family transporter n=1 Tax=Thalassobacillus pellis TaxID=748008 RepID=UPI001961D2DE|nr:DMT family transporter [Thalassobacillus pellis]MBM7553468.1 drug/metabolite transporter (DMT)-like permease [Thalassobacillus pellis]